MPTSEPETTISLVAEAIAVSLRERTTGGVRVETHTEQRVETVEVELRHDDVVVERVPIGRPISVAPPVRQEGDATVISVVEEVAVVERRLMLKEEIWVRRNSAPRIHREDVVLRTQHAEIRRLSAEQMTAGSSPARDKGYRDMASETIVAVFRTPAEAEAVAAELRNAGVKADAIEQHSQAHGQTGADATLAQPHTTEHRSGWWAWLLGEESYQDERTMYDEAISGGGVVLSVIVSDADAARVESIIDQHHPVKVDERVANETVRPAVGTVGAAANAMPARAATAQDSAQGEVIPLAEERLEVGKRSVDEGAAHIRRFVVERPVEEQIRLRTESLRVERRPVTGAGAVAADAFSEKIIEVKQTGEEAVVGKTARVVEEVVVSKDVGERVETVRDKVRKEEVEVTDSRGGRGVAPAAPAKAPAPAHH